MTKKHILNTSTHFCYWFLSSPIPLWSSLFSYIISLFNPHPLHVFYVSRLSDVSHIFWKITNCIPHTVFISSILSPSWHSFRFFTMYLLHCLVDCYPITKIINILLCFQISSCITHILSISWLLMSSFFVEHWENSYQNTKSLTIIHMILELRALYPPSILSLF